MPKSLSQHTKSYFLYRMVHVYKMALFGRKEKKEFIPIL